MTTTTHLPAGITELTEPCWETPNDDETHYPDQDTALEAIEDDEDRHKGTSPTLRLGRCWTAQAACGKWVDADQFGIGHHLTAADALAAALEADFQVVDDVLRCEDGEFCKSRQEL
ncbi:hypothetical protein FHR83_006680 [Actinoplanes campanulatus]|uniref:Uncharacterized protein n=1 Tax=Actinoplanes campanulatus TaxID=113559 RepID=A0A7W5ANA2_9ACTN|nr:hypothetical protein [Actinoplanes campanulatus]MBB3098974.1 hypothetical protein [Actinoplanes campanulatus]GGN39615.1 hypothetical protein GCM10010109_67760 [Actinoplanes campanulatus]